MAGIILRLPLGIKLPEDFITNLRKLFEPEVVEIEYFNVDEVDYCASYNRRRDIFYDAFLFALEAYPPSSPILIDNLKKFAEICKKEYVFDKKNTIEEMQQILIRFTEKLTYAIMDCWPENHTFSEAKACINEAEQYVLLQRGRKALATVMPVEFGNETRYVLQWDKVLRPCSDEFLQELEIIKAQGSPSMPAWYHKLTNAEKTYLSLLPSTCDGIKTLQQDAQKLRNLWTSLQSTRKTALQAECNAIASNNPVLPDWYTKLDKKIQVWFIEESYSKLEASITKFEKICRTLETEATFTQTLQLLSKLPLWYTVLPNMQQSFLRQVLKQNISIEALPSRLRTLPALANAREHHLKILDSRGLCLKEFTPRIGFSHIVSRDVLEFPKAVISRHNNSNLNLVCSLARPEQPIYIGTAISPLSVYAYVQDYLPTKVSDKIPPDLQLAEQLKKIIKQHPMNKSIYHTNHPLNYTKNVAYTESNSPECLALLELAKSREHLDGNLKAIRIIYEQALNSGWGTAYAKDYRGRELFLSSLGHLIIIFANGLSAGSCVSGKDRKAVGLIHDDALFIYHEIYGKWHQFTDPAEERANFVKIVVELYVSRHQHEHAGQNAPGSEGIKTPAMYWPSDIAVAIYDRMKNPNTLIGDDRLATNNEVSKVGLSESKRVPGALLCHLIAAAIPRKICQKIIDALSRVLEERERFKPKVTWKVTQFAQPEEPEGIQKIRELVKGNDSKSLQMSQEIENKNINAVLEKIMLARYLRGNKEDKSRSDLTIAVYDLIKKLYTQVKTLEDIKEVICELDRLHTSSMEKNTCS